MNLPPAIIVQAAEKHASMSPCAKSKRGAVIYSNPQAPRIHGVGYNGPPVDFRCSATPRCRAICGKVCAHAEQRAIRGMLSGNFGPALAMIRGEGPIDMVHIKIGPDGRGVAGGKPSCEQCSVAIVDVGVISGVWLCETSTPAEMETWERLCKGDSVAGSNKQSGPPQPTWRRYTASEFHEATLANRGLGVA